MADVEMNGGPQAHEVPANQAQNAPGAALAAGGDVIGVAAGDGAALHNAALGGPVVVPAGNLAMALPTPAAAVERFYRLPQHKKELRAAVSDRAVYGKLIPEKPVPTGTTNLSSA